MDVDIGSVSADTFGFRAAHIAANLNGVQGVLCFQTVSTQKQVLFPHRLRPKKTGVRYLPPYR